MNASLVNTPTALSARLIAAGQVTLGDIDTPPEWIELLPAGVFSGRDGRGPYRVSDPEAVIAATRALGLETGIPIDYDHATDLAAPEGRPAPAAGWINELAVRNGTIWGRVEWTHHGAAAVTTHEYRYISPVFEHNRDGDVVRLIRAALTNNPNLTLTAISARASRPSNTTEETVEKTYSPELARQLCAVLGIAESSTHDEIIDVARALSRAGMANDSTTLSNARAAAVIEPHPSDAPAHFVSVAQFQETITELNQLRASRASERAEHAVTEAIRLGKLIPAQREWAIAYCVADFDGFEEFVARQPALALGEAEFNSSPTAGRRSSFGASQQSANTLISQAEREICGILGIALDDFVSRKLERNDAAPAAQLR